MEERGLKKRRTKAGFVYENVMVDEFNNFRAPYDF
jgi:hypothetical protein